MGTPLSPAAARASRTCPRRMRPAQRTTGRRSPSGDGSARSLLLTLTLLSPMARPRRRTAIRRLLKRQSPQVRPPRGPSPRARPPNPHPRPRPSSPRARHPPSLRRAQTPRSLRPRLTHRRPRALLPPSARRSRRSPRRRPLRPKLPLLPPTLPLILTPVSSLLLAIVVLIQYLSIPPRYQPPHTLLYVYSVSRVSSPSSVLLS
ncbi:hypothetical protein B0H19DRAFT_80404 [Mycena capillaripes]|nr:hypothetical protein B0H19DRAFT_80404 [Mycena capillaripes]